MATVTLAAELASMHVVPLMAGNTVARKLDLAGRTAVTVRALLLGVSTGQCEAGLPAMIELPLRPAVGRVAGIALRAQCAPMHVLGRMAVDAAYRCGREIFRTMTLRTADDVVQSQEGEFRQVMIEADLAAPGTL